MENTRGATFKTTTTMATATTTKHLGWPRGSDSEQTYLLKMLGEREKGPREKRQTHLPLGAVSMLLMLTYRSKVGRTYTVTLYFQIIYSLIYLFIFLDL